MSITAAEGLDAFLRAPNGAQYGSFDQLRCQLRKEGKSLAFAINGGMYHSNGTPVGLYVSRGMEYYQLNEGPGAGNFFIKPNGVFFQDQSGFGILETSLFKARGVHPEFATQSGPMLVYGGHINSRLIPSSKSSFVRSGVCLKSTQEALFAITNVPMNFYSFAEFLQKELGCSEALYLDGFVSSLFLPDLERNDQRYYKDGSRVRLGPIIAVVRFMDRPEPDMCRSR